MRRVLTAAVVICSNVFGNLLLKKGMENVPPLAAPLDFVTVVFQPFIAAGIVLLILWMLSRMALLSWADLTYAIPITSLGFALNLFVAKVFLQEPVGQQRLLGTACIVAGTLLVSLTPAKTTITVEGEKP
jgi:drug/metabolite transporter (DMT)-like permease